MGQTPGPNGTTLSTINLSALQAIAERCFELSMDGSIPLPQQGQYNALGNRLVGDLGPLTSAYFDQTQQQFANAAQALTSVNNRLSQAATDLANDMGAIAAVTTLANTLDTLLTMVAKFA